VPLARVAVCRLAARYRRVEVNGIRWTCDVPFQSWTKHFRGVAQLETTEQLEAGALPDGYNIPVDLDVSCTGMSVPYDYATAHLEQSWATRHYEQHISVEGELRYGDQSVAISGTGLRDHSWGPRDYTKLGYSTWIQGQFPTSGRSFMVVRVTGVPPSPELTYGLTSDRDGQYQAIPSELRIARVFQDADEDYEFSLITADGTVSTIKGQILRSTRCSFHGAAQMVLGIDRRPTANHHYVDAFTRFEWDGEVGYGVTEYTVDLYPGNTPPPV